MKTATKGSRSGNAHRGAARGRAKAKLVGSDAKRRPPTPARRTTPPREPFHWPALKLGAELRRDIIAIGLVVLALLTVWSLLGARGGVLGFWRAGLRGVFGWAAILIPLALLLWVIDAFREHPIAPFGPRQRHIVGTLLLLAAILGLLHLPAPDPVEWGRLGKGGGYLGYFISSPLVAAVRPIGAALVLLGFATVALVVTFNTNLRAIGQSLGAAAGKLRHKLRQWYTARQEDADRQASARQPEPVRRPVHANEARVQLEREHDDGPVINLPTPMRGETAAKGALARLNTTSQPTLDEPVDPLVLGAGQLPLLDNPALTKAPNLPQYPMPHVIDLPLFDSVMPNRDELDRKAHRIEETLAAFKVEARVREINPGAAVTQFALEPGAGVPVRRIKALENDLALALAASSITIETPIPGQSRVGIVIPNKSIAKVGLRETMESSAFVKSKAKLPIALGRDVNANYIVADLAKMPHLLIAGSTGSGKSVCLNSIISTFLLTRTPDELKLVMIDPKMVELVGYNGIPHLKSPVIIEMDRVVGTLRKVLSEMERRYQLFSKLKVRNIDGYGQLRASDPALENLPYLVVIIDELADLMMTAPDEVETVLVRLAQMARATGIHLIIATQRPSVDVLTGLIKANFPARIAFAVTSQVDSRVILDGPGADRLLGRGDMLFQDPNSAKPVRVQGTFVDDPDIERIVSHWRTAVPEPRYEPEWMNVPAYHPGGAEADDGSDPLMLQAQAIVRQHGTASASMLQRRLRIGYNRAARLIEQMEDDGFIGPSEGARGRTILPARGGADSDDTLPFDDE